MPEWLAVIAILIAWAQGLMLGGIFWARGPFWDGVRSVYSFGRSRLDKQERIVNQWTMENQRPPWAMYGAEWLIESWDGTRIKEQLAYCKSFACAEAAYDAAVKAMPYEHITFRHRARLIREHVGKWTADAR